MELLTSLTNPKVKRWRSLKDRKGRLETGCFLVEGRKSVEEALNSGFLLEALLIEEHEVPPPVPDNTVYRLPAHVLAAVCDTKTPQGIAAVLRIKKAALPGGRLVALDGVQDPGNVGTIIRTADAVGLDGVLLSPDCADPYAPKTIRATMGSIFHLPVVTVADLVVELTRLRDEGSDILSSQLDGQPFRSYRAGGHPFVLVIGSEGNGVSPTVSALATHRLKLPMHGRAESLNAAVAAGIMMYELAGWDGEP